MPDERKPDKRRSNAYNLFILVLTVFSLAIMAALLFPLSDATIQLLIAYDNLICVVFLFDFFFTLWRAPSRRDYFFAQHGWLDLLGSIPSFGFFKYAALLRLARISRLLRIVRILRRMDRRQLVADLVRNRGQYAAFVTVLSAFIVISLASVLVLQFESGAANANITTGGDALWWAVVTITTVGYGDTFPVTTAGRLTGVFVMFTGVGIIGALASILSSVLVPTAASDEATGETPPAETGELRAELDRIGSELTALRAMIAGTSGAPPA